MLTWAPDALAGFEAATFPVPDAGEGPVPATLVRMAGARPAGRPAVLHVHGYNDYFFHRHLAQAWSDRGFEFFALDLRRCGRSWRPWQTPHQCTSLWDYGPELTAAAREIRARGHDHLVVHAHSTGGLVAALWARGPGAAGVSALVLDAPLLDLKATGATRSVGLPVAAVLGRFAPDLVVSDPGSAYAGRLHTSGGGEWDFDLALKRPTGVPVRAGWVRAVRAGLAAVRAGLDLPMPVLVALATASGPDRDDNPDAGRQDVVLDVARVAQLAPRLARDTTVVRLPGAVHDLALSAPPVRAAYLRTVFDWLATHADLPPGASTWQGV